MPTITPSIFELFNDLIFFISSIEETPPEITKGIFTLLDNSNIEGVIIGKAIYDGDIKINDLAELI